jgi:hypothetical protein
VGGRPSGKRDTPREGRSAARSRHRRGSTPRARTPGPSASAGMHRGEERPERKAQRADDCQGEQRAAGHAAEPAHPAAREEPRDCRFPAEVLGDVEHLRPDQAAHHACYSRVRRVRRQATGPRPPCCRTQRPARAPTPTIRPNPVISTGPM